jgi:Na+/melibiose symporter-like transporter
VRLLDLFVDPALGVIMDRTTTPFGRYRFWIAIGAPILMLSTWALFLAPVGVGMAYLVGWLFIYYLAYSILTLGHSAWGATVSTAYHERSRVFGVVATIGVIGAVVVLLIPIFADRLHHSDAQAVRDMGWFMLWSIPITMGLTVLRTPEVVNRDAVGSHFRLSDYIALLTKPDLLRLFTAQICLTLGPGWMSALYLFFFTESRGYSPSVASALLLLYVLAGVMGAPLTAHAAQKFGKHRTLMATTTAYSLGLCTVLIIPKGNVIAALPTMFWCGFMAAGFDLMIRAMLADVGDEVRLEQGREQLSLIYALNTLAAKLAAAFSIGLTFPLLGYVGYVAKEGVKNTPQAIHNLELAYIIGPIVFVMLGGVCVVGWRLDEAKHTEIRRKLDLRDGVQPAPALYEEAPILESVGVTPAVAVLTQGTPDAASR